MNAAYAMSSLEGNVTTRLGAALAHLLRRLRTCVTARDDALFTEFLPRGYELMTLDAVPAAQADRLLLAKVRIGMLITLYDDLADNPRWRSPRDLRALYCLPFASISSRAAPLVQLAAALWGEVLAVLRSLPQYEPLAPLFEFDVQQVYQAMRYSEALAHLPGLANQAENRVYLAHNMGLTLVGTMDLMALPRLPLHELGHIRRLLMGAQQVARLSNVLCTWQRELREGDCTSELAAMAMEAGGVTWEALRKLSGHAAQQLVAPQVAQLRASQTQLLGDLHMAAAAIQSFDARVYIDALAQLDQLHRRLQAHL